MDLLPHTLVDGSDLVGDCGEADLQLVHFRFVVRKVVGALRPAVGEVSGDGLLALVDDGAGAVGFLRKGELKFNELLWIWN